MPKLIKDKYIIPYDTLLHKVIDLQEEQGYIGKEGELFLVKRENIINDIKTAEFALYTGTLSGVNRCLVDFDGSNTTPTIKVVEGEADIPTTCESILQLVLCKETSLLYYWTGADITSGRYKAIGTEKIVVDETTVTQGVADSSYFIYDSEKNEYIDVNTLENTKIYKYPSYLNFPSYPSSSSGENLIFIDEGTGKIYYFDSGYYAYESKYIPQWWKPEVKTIVEEQVRDALSAAILDGGSPSSSY